MEGAMTHTETPGNRIMRTVRPTVIAYDWAEMVRTVRFTVDGRPAKATVTAHDTIRLSVEPPCPTKIP